MPSGIGRQRRFGPLLEEALSATKRNYLEEMIEQLQAMLILVEGKMSPEPPQPPPLKGGLNLVKEQQLENATM